jgi:hypothetical protein
MANSLTPLSPKFWSKTIGRKRYKATVYKSIGSSAEQAGLEFGNKVDRPYRANLVVENYVKGVAAVAQDLTATSDELTIDKQKTILMYVDKVDKIQNKWDAARASAEEAGKRLGIAIDAEFLYEAALNANNVVDDGTLGGTTGTGITITANNISDVVGHINKKLDEQNVGEEEGSRFWVISPQIKRALWSYISGKESLLGDKTGEYNNLGRYGGLELYLSNNLTASAVWTPANQPSDGDTITIDGVVFTFETGTLDAAGKVKSETSTAVTLDNLVAFINAGGNDSVIAQGYTLSQADQRIVQEMVAVDGTTFVTIYHKGKSYMTVTGSDAADTWTLHTQHSLAGVKGSTDIVVQLEPEVQMASTVPNGKAGMNIMLLTVLGVKSFNQGKNENVDVKVASSTF